MLFPGPVFLNALEYQVIPCRYLSHLRITTKEQSRASLHNSFKSLKEHQKYSSGKHNNRIWYNYIIVKLRTLAGNVWGSQYIKV